MAGDEGFEPPNGGTRTHCLTTWRIPNGLCDFITFCTKKQNAPGAEASEAPRPKRKLEAKSAEAGLDHGVRVHAATSMTVSQIGNIGIFIIEAVKIVFIDILRVIDAI